MQFHCVFTFNVDIYFIFDFFNLSDLKTTFTLSLFLQQSLMNLIRLGLILSKYSQNGNKLLSEND